MKMSRQLLEARFSHPLCIQILFSTDHLWLQREAGYDRAKVRSATIRIDLGFLRKGIKPQVLQICLGYGLTDMFTIIELYETVMVTAQKTRKKEEK